MLDCWASWDIFCFPMKLWTLGSPAAGPGLVSPVGLDQARHAQHALETMLTLTASAVPCLWLWCPMPQHKPFISEYLHADSLCLTFCVPVELCTVDLNKISNSSAGACITLDVVPVSRTSPFSAALQMKPQPERWARLHLGRCTVVLYWDMCRWKGYFFSEGCLLNETQNSSQG